MNTNLIYIFISLLLSISLLLTTIMLSKKSLNKMCFTPFECGFNPLSPIHQSFSIQFFLIALLFLIFDVEIILILPFPITKIKSMSFCISSISTLLILLMGLIYEWKTNSLLWF